MKIAVIGSCVGGDIVAKNKNKLGLELGLNYVSFNPISFVGGGRSLLLSKDLLLEETPAQQERIISDYLGGNYIIEKIKNSNPDFLFVDLSDFRIGTKTIEFENGEKLVLTNRTLNQNTQLKINQFLEKSVSKIKSEKVKSFNEYSDDELDYFVKNFIEMIYNNFEKSKVFFFKIKLACQYFSGNSFEYTPQFQIAGGTNDMIDRIYKLAERYITFANPPKNIIGDKDCLSPFEFHFSNDYYEYMAKCFQNFVKTKSQDDQFLNQAKINCENEIQKKITSVFCNQILSRISQRLEKDIVLIAPTRQFDYMLFEKYGKNIYGYIEYNQNSDLFQIENQIKKLNDKNQNLIFVIPELFNHGAENSLYLIFYKLQVNFANFFYYIPKPITLDKFSGKLSDVYHNNFDVATPANIQLKGIANNINIKKQKLSPTIIIFQSNINLTIRENNSISIILEMFLGSCAEIGVGNSVGSGARFCCPALSKLKIGNDCMFSFNEMVYAGDGHSIFVKKDNIYEKINHCYNDKIEIGNHVWVGYRCHILSGTKIGDGSIVGAGSLVNKKFPNNVTIVGSPAKIIKRNVAWSRNPLITKLEQDKNIFENFANETFEDEKHID